MDAAAHRRVDDGQVATAQATGRLEERTADLLRRALSTEQAARTAPPRPGTAATPGPSSPAAPGPPGAGAAGPPIAAGASAGNVAPGRVPEERVERALALVERIERFLRSGRPSLALTLRGGIPGQLEVQRVAPGTIALRLSSTRQPSRRELGELRQALETRGLSVRSLEMRRVTPESGEASAVRASAADACSPSP